MSIDKRDPDCLVITGQLEAKLAVLTGEEGVMLNIENIAAIALDKADAAALGSWLLDIYEVLKSVKADCVKYMTNTNYIAGYHDGVQDAVDAVGEALKEGGESRE